MDQKADLAKIFIGVLAGTVVIGGAIYVSYLYSQKQGEKLSLPGGTTYLGEPGDSQVEIPPAAPVLFTAPSDTAWVSFKGENYPYSFSYPETLPLTRFQVPLDSVGVSWGDLDPRFNILLDVESVAELDPENIGDLEGFVQDWWKAFPGLKGVASVDKITNTNGLVGYRAVYIDNLDETSNLHIFFGVSQDPDLVIHLANSVLDAVIFDRIVDSVKWSSSTPTLAPTPFR